MSTTVKEETEYDLQLPALDDKLMKYYQDCSDKVVERHHMCGGCMQGQFYCELFAKIRRTWNR